MPSDGSLIAEYARERRLYVPIQAVPEARDRRLPVGRGQEFLQARGHRPGRVSCAPSWSNLRSGGAREQGASTITQQVAKNFLVGNERSYERKIREALIALRMESTFSKDKILELYLNEIFLGTLTPGRNLHGIAAAALDYFGKSDPRADHRRGRLHRGPAEGPEQLPSLPPAQGRHRAPQLGDRPHGRERLHHARKRRRGQEGAAQRQAAHGLPEQHRLRLFRRGRAPRHRRALWRGKPL